MPACNQGRFEESLSAYSEGLSKDPKNESASGERSDVESAARALVAAKEAMNRVRRSSSSSGGRARGSVC